VPRQNIQGTCSFFLTPAQTSDPEGRFLSNTPVLAHTFEYNPSFFLKKNEPAEKMAGSQSMFSPKKKRAGHALRHA